MFNLGNDNYISPGSIGGKIKKIREHRGWSQKELGIYCGFSPSTADVRIRQYETNKKIPREKAINTLANALQIDQCSIFDADLLVKNRAYHALFDIEDFFGLHPVKIDDKYYLEFSGPTILGNKEAQYYETASFLKEWATIREIYLPKPEDNEETKKEKRKKYDLWRYEYPLNKAQEFEEKLSIIKRKQHLEQELEELNKLLESKKDK